MDNNLRHTYFFFKSERMSLIHTEVCFSSVTSGRTFTSQEHHQEPKEGNENVDDEIDRMITSFFTSASKPITNHQEWLLRMCSQLMQREASVVSIVERQAKNRTSMKCKTPFQSSAESTKPYTEMEEKL